MPVLSTSTVAVGSLAMRILYVFVIASTSLSIAGCSAFNTVSDATEQTDGAVGTGDGAVGSGEGFTTFAEPPATTVTHQPGPRTSMDAGPQLRLPDTHVDLSFVASTLHARGPTHDEDGSTPDAGIACEAAGDLDAGECVPEVIEIDDCAGLQTIWNDLAASYRLTADIDCTDFYEPEYGGFRPIGNGFVGQHFTGKFDGAGHTVRGLRIDYGSTGEHSFNLGLFGYVEDAVIERVDVVDAYINGSSDIAALVGNSVRTTVRECHASGTVIGTYDVGGLVGGEFGGSVVDSYTSAMTVSAMQDYGLVVGWVEGLVQRVYSSGTTVATEARLISLCQWDYCSNHSSTHNSFFDCDVAGTCSGLGGSSTAMMTSIHTFTNAGWEFDRTWGFFAPNGYPCLRWQPGCGCLAGRDSDGDGTDDCQDSCIADGAQESTADDDGDQILNCLDPDWVRPVHDCADLQALRARRGMKHRLVKDVDCTGFDVGDGKGFEPIGELGDPFTGSLDGDGHVVTGLTILRNDRLEYTGLIGAADGALIQRVGVVEAQVEGNRRVGVLAGGGPNIKIRESFATGSVKGAGFDVGGLLGGQYEDGWVRDSYADVTVEGGDASGLLVGRQEATIQRCYASGPSTAAKLSTPCPNCPGPLLLDSFFDCDVAGPCPTFGEGIPTTSMKSQSTYLRAGWDFDAVWSQKTTESYPCLRWEVGCGR
jgi:hypothetical protein